MVAISLLAGSLVACAQGYRSYRPRQESCVDRTERDLEALLHRTAAFDSGRERVRYDNALHHLSEFQNELYRGRFDRGKLSRAIGNVQNVVRHNLLDDRARGMLLNDLNSLQAFRAAHG
jgi:hypothetical protein